ARCLVQQNIQPLLIPTRPLVLSQPTGRAAYTRKRLGPKTNARFVRVGEVPIMVLPLALPQLEAAIQHPAGFQRSPSPLEGIWELLFGYMQQAGACPDAVITLTLVHFIKAFYRNANAQQLAGMAGQWFAGVESADLISQLLKCQSIAA